MRKNTLLLGQALNHLRSGSFISEGYITCHENITTNISVLAIATLSLTRYIWADARHIPES